MFVKFFPLGGSRGGGRLQRKKLQYIEDTLKLNYMFIADYRNEKQRNYHSELKAVISGNKLEMYRFVSPIFFGQKIPKTDYDENGNKIEKIKYVMTEEEKHLSSTRRAKRNIRRTICANAWKWFDKNNKAYLPITLTLTFAEEIKDIKQANNMFSNFIQRLNYSVNRIERGFSKKEAKKNLLKYTAVIEFQDKTRGGVIHYHVIFYNLPKMTKIYDRLIKIWGKGYFWVGAKKKKGKISCIRDQKRLDKIVEYFTKYLTKGFNDKRLTGKKKYFNARQLLKPVEVFVEELVLVIKDKLPEEAKDFSSKDLKYKYKNTERSFNYARYDLSAYPKVLTEVLELANMYC